MLALSLPTDPAARAPLPPPESIHPDLWRAGSLAGAAGRVLGCGHAELAAALPGGGWPRGALTELLLVQPGIGEFTLLLPALREAVREGGRVVLLAPPQPPNAACLRALGFDAGNLLHVRVADGADLVWAAEQILRSDSCAALLAWLPPVRDVVLHRLHLAARQGTAAVWLIRPEPAARQASPAPLRLRLRPLATAAVEPRHEVRHEVPHDAPSGWGGTRRLAIDLLKRRGPRAAQPLTLVLG